MKRTKFNCFTIIAPICCIGFGAAQDLSFKPPDFHQMEGIANPARPDVDEVEKARFPLNFKRLLARCGGIP